ncbi:hypothetical protein WT60_19070 [Burkholderia sp. MSMB617WGS]|uniref:Uncharacterized protein n=1 Tax=Burkholderia savannae TaxID=1637837 RepID=A0ABR5T2A5_9BURK|nr:hypothetical protein WS78_29265 [Burkholderia savannae]AOK49072.1 hypothetical protein WT60_19070 [Burkholderia sp. MSMB617WGS]KVG45004.1 hypothetical protein WS77_07485 [Burkholderia sp. MSMB0265]KVG89994.1 hypothetical protein WS81_19720 [Burkholderia sp. MSMB2040]KVG96131.1 hypothetical protein WS82_02895 [Burkholderia sp. MSMB2041]KVG99759.1 hypothetical protein WS83_24930 [Burkholderia sp. MSMB2042]KVK73632.1 hypothetical protein WS91_20020 [Burkholderia sp. MSMB1498]
MPDSSAGDASNEWRRCEIIRRPAADRRNDDKQAVGRDARADTAARAARRREADRDAAEVAW